MHRRYFSTLLTRGVRALAGVCVLLPAACLTSCNVMGGAAYLVAGPEKVPALYNLDTTRKTVVFIDDTQPFIKSRLHRVKVGTTTEQLLLDKAKVEHVISSQDLLAVATRDRGSTPMSIIQVGEAVGAEVVIYAQITAFDLTPDGQTFAPFARARLKVVDVTNKKRLWPEGLAEWHALDVTAPTRQGAPPRGSTELNAEYDALATRLGTTIGQVFYKHQARTPDGRIDR